MTQQAGAAQVVDTHVHIFDPVRFPYGSHVSYRPKPHETAPAESLIAVMDAHAISHAVVVTPMAGYQSDNSAMLDALARYPDRLAGVAVVEGDIAGTALDDLARRGVRGVRVDLIGRGTRYLNEAGRRLPALLKERGMLLQIQCEHDQLAAVAPLLRAEAGTVLIDHMGRPEPARGLAQDGFRALLALADRAQTHVKLSGPFRFSKLSAPHADVDPFAAAIIGAFGPDRCMWGSDWPFVRMDCRLDYGPVRHLAERWLSDPDVRQRVLWRTPARLFGLRPLTGAAGPSAPDQP